MQQAIASVPASARAAAAGATGGTSPYSALMAEMDDFDQAFGGLALDQTALALHMPQDHVSSWIASYSAKPIASVTPSSNTGIVRAMIRQGIREVTLCKDAKGMIGLAVDAWDKGVFVAFVWAGSAAALGGLRFGDQIVEINGSTVAGWSSKQTLKFLFLNLYL